MWRAEKMVTCLYCVQIKLGFPEKYHRVLTEVSWVGVTNRMILGDLLDFHGLGYFNLKWGEGADAQGPQNCARSRATLRSIYNSRLDPRYERIERITYEIRLRMAGSRDSWRSPVLHTRDAITTATTTTAKERTHVCPGTGITPKGSMQQQKIPAEQVISRWWWPLRYTTGKVNWSRKRLTST